MIARRRPAGSTSGGRFQFGMRGLMATVMLLCVPFAIWGGLLRGGQGAQGGTERIVFVLLCVAAPMGVMILLAAYAAAARVWRGWRRKRNAAGDDDAADFASRG